MAALALQFYELANPRYFSFAKPAIAHIDAHRQKGEPLYVHPATTEVYLWYHPEVGPDVYVHAGERPAMQAERCWLLLSYVPVHKSDDIRVNPIPPNYHIDPQQSWQRPGGEALLLIRDN